MQNIKSDRNTLDNNGIRKNREDVKVVTNGLCTRKILKCWIGRDKKKKKQHFQTSKLILVKDPVIFTNKLEQESVNWKKKGY